SISILSRGEDSSRWVTDASTTPSRRSNSDRTPEVAPLFRKEENHARELEHSGNQLKNYRGEEWPERAEQCRVVQLQEEDWHADGREHIENDRGKSLAFDLSQVQTSKGFSARNYEHHENHKCDTAAPSPDSQWHRFHGEQQQSHHAKTQRQDGIGEQ